MPDDTECVVYIVDDDPGMRRSLLMLTQSAGLQVEAFESAELLLAGLRPEHPGCVVLDLRMPGMGGIELLQTLRAELNDIPVILISGHADVPDTVRGMKLGAVDLLQKPVEPSVLLDCICKSLEVSQALHQGRRETQLIRQRFERLTSRELELLTLVVDGHANKKIAVEMGISIKTVANHRASLMVKTDAANAADLARLYTIFRALQHAPEGYKYKRNDVT